MTARTRLFVGLLPTLLALAGVIRCASFAAPGDLDHGFGTGGKVTTAIGSENDYARAVAVQGDGKIVTAGYAWNGTDFDFALARYTSAGTLDVSFGSGGKVSTPIGAGNDFGRGVAVQGDGRIVVAGYRTCPTNGFGC